MCASSSWASRRPPSPSSRAWDRSPELVNDHDFRSDAAGLAVPYGIYDPRANAGTVFVGRSADTPAFAVDCIEKWWRTEGRKHYPDAEALQILADGGGSNSCTARAWKFNLQHRLCNPHGVRVTVAHYPPATSKWNPIEHRLFCEIRRVAVVGRVQFDGDLFRPPPSPDPTMFHHKGGQR